MEFNASLMATLLQEAFMPDYPGYRPNVIEAPNGDGNWDNLKQYSHIATKYIDSKECPLRLKHFFEDVLVVAHKKAMSAAIKLGIPEPFFPDIEAGAVRILKYPPGAVTHEHTDFNLFTLMLYRNIPDTFNYVQNFTVEKDTVYDEVYSRTMLEQPRLVPTTQMPSEEFQKEFPQIHYGELMEHCCPFYSPTPHMVGALSDGRWQYSMVYFAVPNHKALLPSGKSIGAWLDERIARSRKEVY